MNEAGWNEPKRVRRSIHERGRHLGYVTLVAYPGRDITIHTEGSPYREVVISDDREGHVALLQRFKAHWLVQCGRDYGTSSQVVEMTELLAIRVATFALQLRVPGPELVEHLIEKLDETG